VSTVVKAILGEASLVPGAQPDWPSTAELNRPAGEEHREVQIGRELLRLSGDPRVRILAKELIQLHR